MPITSWPRAVVFDLDGTLIDSAGDIADVLNVCLAEEGIAPFDESTVVTMIGGGARVLVERALTKLGRHEDEALLQRLFHGFAARYEALGAGRSKPFPGAVALLDALARDRIGLAICTNKPAAISQRVLDELGLASWFGAVIGETPHLPRKPAPDMVLAALAGLSATPPEAVMIGDSGADIGAAKAAGVKTIAVSFGYTTTPPRELGADIVIDHFDEALAALERLR